MASVIIDARRTGGWNTGCWLAQAWVAAQQPSAFFLVASAMMALAAQQPVDRCRELIDRRAEGCGDSIEDRELSLTHASRGSGAVPAWWSRGTCDKRPQALRPSGIWLIEPWGSSMLCWFTDQGTMQTIGPSVGKQQSSGICKRHPISSDPFCLPLCSASFETDSNGSLLRNGILVCVPLCPLA